MLFISTQGNRLKTLAYSLARLELTLAIVWLRKAYKNFLQAYLNVADDRLCSRSNYTSCSLARVELNSFVWMSYLYLFTSIGGKLYASYANDLAQFELNFICALLYVSG